MADFFLGEIRFFAFDKIPKGWLPCQGQLLPLNGNIALFSLLGTVYGGDGRTTFGLPDLRGVVPLSIGPTYPAGAGAGNAVHTLTTNEIPMHTHQATGSTKGPTVASAAGNTWATAPGEYAQTPDTTMSPQALSIAGSSQAHSNMQPYLTLSLCISTTGIFPSRP